MTDLLLGRALVRGDDKSLVSNLENILYCFGNFPSCSPEHNPDEYLNGDRKNHMHSRLPSRTKKDLSRKTRSFVKHFGDDRAESQTILNIS